LKSFKNENKKQLVELEKLEKKLESLQNKEKKTINNVVFDQKYFLKFWITGVVILLVAYIFFQSLQIIYLIMAAYIMSVAIEAVIEFFEKRIHSRVLSIFLAYLFLLFLVL
jgi:predicted PurR-regulated permease PerM